MKRFAIILSAAGGSGTSSAAKKIKSGIKADDLINLLIFSPGRLGGISRVETFRQIGLWNFLSVEAKNLSERVSENQPVRN